MNELKIELPPFDEKYGHCFPDCLSSIDYYHTYIIKIDGMDFYKIGVTFNLEKRLMGYNSPFDHEYVAIYSEDRRKNKQYRAESICRELEKFLLNKYEEYSVKGEWIKLDYDLYNQLITDLFYFGKQIHDNYIRMLNVA